jgi:hypothetical protein
MRRLGRIRVSASPLAFATDGETRDAVEIVTRALAGTANQEVFLFIHEILPVVFAHLEVIA